MAKFLNTSATTYLLEELIKNADEKLILISPYLKINNKIKELLEDKNRMKIDIRIVYGKAELKPLEIAWLAKMEYIRTSYCKDLHAKCYLSEKEAIITSLNLYEFSQINNNEMGVHISRDIDHELYIDTLKESQRLIRISEEANINIVEKKTPLKLIKQKVEPIPSTSTNREKKKIATSKMASKMKKTTAEVLIMLLNKGYITSVVKGNFLTNAGSDAGGEFRSSYGGYYLWPDITP